MIDTGASSNLSGKWFRDAIFKDSLDNAKYGYEERLRPPKSYGGVGQGSTIADMVLDCAGCVEDGSLF